MKTKNTTTGMKKKVAKKKIRTIKDVTVAQKIEIIQRTISSLTKDPERYNQRHYIHYEESSTNSNEKLLNVIQNRHDRLFNEKYKGVVKDIVNMKENTCGTTCCIAGWMTLHMADRKMVNKFENYNIGDMAANIFSNGENVDGKGNTPEHHMSIYLLMYTIFSASFSLVNTEPTSYIINDMKMRMIAKDVDVYDVYKLLHKINVEKICELLSYMILQLKVYKTISPFSTYLFIHRRFQNTMSVDISKKIVQRILMYAKSAKEQTPIEKRDNMCFEYLHPDLRLVLFDKDKQSQIEMIRHNTTQIHNSKLVDYLFDMD